MIEPEAREAMAVEMYYRVRCEPAEGSVSAAWRRKTQACGFVAYVLDMTADEVAFAVAEDARRRLDRKVER